jgi:hypothetical protein
MDPGRLNTLSQALNSTEALLSSSLHAVYRTAIGQLLYLTTKTRPDIAVAVGVLTRQVSAPAEVHWTAVKRILRYLKGTRMYGLHIAPTNDQLIGHADADWGGESDRKSVSGFVITLGNVPVSWGGKTHVAYRDSYPDTIMIRVKSVPLLPCWTWTVFLIFMFLEWSACLSDPAKSLVVEPYRNFSKILVFRRVFGAALSSIIARFEGFFSPASSMGFPLPHETVFS